MSVERSPGERTDEPRQTTSYCRICPAACGVIVESVGDQIIGVTGDSEHPLSAGYTCSKGRAAPEMHHHPGRLDTPMMRADGGTLQPVSWGRALDDIANRLRLIVEAHGAEAVAQYTGSSGYDMANVMAMGFLGGLGSRQSFTPLTIDSTAKWWVPELMFGAGFPWPMCPDLAVTDLLLLIGHNPIVSHGHAHRVDNPVVALRDVSNRGGTVIVVDPRVTESARQADIHVQLRPGSDPALLGFLVREVLRSRPDVEFLDAVDPQSLDRLTDAVAPYTLDSAAATCGVEPAVLDRVWEAVRSTSRIALASGTGASMNASANVTEWLGAALLTVTGSLDRGGGTIFNPGVIVPRDSHPMPPDIAYEDRFETQPSGRRVPRIMNGLPCASLPEEILAGFVRALLVVGGNPAVVFPESEKTLEALEALDLLVVTEIRETDTTALATHVLPTVSQFERADINLSILSADTFAQYTPAVVAPGAERRPTWWIYSELSRRLGVPLFGHADVDAMLDGTIADDDTVLALVAGQSRIPFATIRAAQHGVTDDDAPSPGWLVPGLLARLIDLAPPSILEQFDGWQRDLPEEGELVLICRRLPRQVNSMLREVEFQRSRGPHPTLLVHPDDAVERGLEDGELVEVTSAHGAVRAIAEVTDSIVPGAVSLTHAWASPNANALTSYEDVDPVTLMPRFTGRPVTVVPVRDPDRRTEPAWH